jgi:hypothetical protein
MEFRKPRYRDMAERFGVSVEAADLFGPNANRTPTADEFLEVLHGALAREVNDNPLGAETLERYLAACAKREGRAPSLASARRG